jgi:cytochrome P450
MVSILDLDLEHVPLETQELADNPLPFFAAARARHPWLGKSNLGVVITEYHAMKEVLGKDAALRFPSHETVSLMGAEETGWGRYVSDFLIMRRGEPHTRLRNAVAEAFTPRAVNRMRPVIRQSMSEVLDEWAPKGAFDFADFASNFPVRVFFDLMGADIAEVPAIRHALEVYGASFAMDPTKMPEIEAAYQDFLAFVDRLVKERGPNDDRDDLLNDMIAANTSGGMTDFELRQMLILMIGAGYDTSKNQLTLITSYLLDKPDIWARCAEDRDYCVKVVEEGLRFGSPSNTYRVVTEAFEYRDVTFPAGTMLIFPLAISGRDPDAIPEADRFDPERKQGDRHLGFGRGAHMCLGQYLARANLEEGLHLTAQRITNPRATAPALWRPFPGVWGLDSLPIAFDPAPPRAQRLAAE